MGISLSQGCCRKWHSQLQGAAVFNASVSCILTLSTKADFEVVNVLVAVCTS